MAAVLKQAEISSSSTSLSFVEFNVQDVQSRAERVIEEAQAKAEALIAAATAKADSIFQEAYDKGLAEAVTATDKRIQETAQRLSDQRCKTAITACEASVNELANETVAWLNLWRNQTIEIAIQIAEKLVRRELQDRDEILRVWMEEALVAMRDARDIRILVHPDDFAVAGRFLQHLAKIVPQAASAEVIPDPEVKLGGCIVRCTNGQIDQQLETQLQRLVAQLT
ncbi:MAG: hypothetical protein KDB03_13290 [Planctomycetales bacterium]|nr:hypothetical protein [Planctomycetales bacterium]